MKRFRVFYWSKLRRWDSELCDECGRPVNIVWWCHDSFLWERITGKRGRGQEPAGGLRCIHCFDAAAKELCPWIEWAPLNLRHLQSPDEENRTIELRERS